MAKIKPEADTREKIPIAVAILGVSLGGLALSSACLVNPWVARWYHKMWIDYVDTAFEYMAYALITGSMLIVLGVVVSRSGRWGNALLLVMSLAVVILIDRALLFYWGRSPWIVDADLYYRHRSGITHTFSYWYRGHASTLAQANVEQRFVRINKFGYHDD